MDNTNDVIMRNVNPETLEEQRCALGRLMAQGSPASIKDMNLLFGLESMLDAWSDEEYFKDNPEADVPAAYNVPVMRTGYSFTTIRVLATNVQDAEKTALDKAGDFEYTEKYSDYSIST